MLGVASTPLFISRPSSCPTFKLTKINLMTVEKMNQENSMQETEFFGPHSFTESHFRHSKESVYLRLYALISIAYLVLFQKVYEIFDVLLSNSQRSVFYKEGFHFHILIFCTLQNAKEQGW